MDSNLKQNIIKIYGVKGKQWLDSLPEITAKIANEHNLSALTPVNNMTFNYVASGYQNDTPIILKIGMNSKALANQLVKVLDEDYIIDGFDHAVEKNLDKKYWPDGELKHEGVQPPADDSGVDMTLLKALVKAHLWQRQLKSGKYSGMKELCERESITAKYAQLILRLNFLAPKLKEAIINGTQPRHLKLADLMNNVPLLWNEQEEMFGLRVLHE